VPKTKVKQAGSFVDLGISSADLTAALAGISSVLDMDPVVGGISTTPGTHVGTNIVGSSAGTGAVTVNVPAGVQAGDMMLAIIEQPGITSTVNLPSGWTQLYQADSGAGTSWRRQIAFYKVASASEPASYTFTSNATDLTAAISVYRNVVTPVFIGAGVDGAAFPSATVLQGATVIGAAGAHSGTAISNTGGGTTLANASPASGIKLMVEAIAAGAPGSITPAATVGGGGTVAIAATVVLNPSGASHTSVLANSGKVVEMTNVSSATFTIAPNSAAAIPVGNFIVVRRMGPGAVTLVPGSGVTLNGVTSIPNQYDEVWLHKTGTDAWHATVRPGTDLATQLELDAVVAALAAVGSNNQTGTAYTLVLTDAGKVVEANNAATVTVTVPPNSAVAFPIGTVIELWQQGAGQLLVAAGAGVTIRSSGGFLKSYGQYSSLSLRKRATDEWVLVGDLVA
jgi:hypothetical protein